MIAEMASAEQGGSKADWITDAYSAQIPNNFGRIKAVIWFNEDKETDWRIESSPPAQNAFATAFQDNFYARNQYASLSESPIPTPSRIEEWSCLYLPFISQSNKAASE
jgi:endoglucanase